MTEATSISDGEALERAGEDISFLYEAGAKEWAELLLELREQGWLFLKAPDPDSIRCPKCLRPREGNENPAMGLSFAGPCPHCGHDFGTPERAPRIYVYLCPICGKQHKPHVDHNLGPNLRVSCRHGHPGERGVDTVQLVRVEVLPIDFVPRPIPHDGCPEWIEDEGAEEGEGRGARQCGKGRDTGVCPDHGPTIREEKT